MKVLKHNLFRQFISIGIIIFGIVFISLGLILPKVLLPIYEKNIYNYLKQPLEFIDTNIGDNDIVSDIGYLFITPKKNIVVSENFEDLIGYSPQEIIEKADQPFGKMNIEGKTYYYYTSGSDYISKISITTDIYINQIKQDVIFVIFPVLFITLLLILLLIIIWTRRLVLKIYYLKEKIANIDNENYDLLYRREHLFDDELNALSTAIDDMHTTLKTQEDYKNQMYQSISHDFKTPITVVKSYIEAIEDGVIDVSDGGDIIKEQINKLENKVHSLLYLNKISYLKDHIEYTDNNIDVKDIVDHSVEKFKFQKPEIVWEVKKADNSLFMGTNDLWEAIVDNLFNNFIRYAESKIRVTLKKDKVIFYNDGPNIDKAIINDLFNPYKKGIHGKFGLGLSIIEKSLGLMGYSIFIKNEKKGVTFTITKCS